MILRIVVGFVLMHLSNDIFADLINPGLIGEEKENDQQILSQEDPADLSGRVSLPLRFSLHSPLSNNKKIDEWIEDISWRIEENGEEEMENRRALDDLRFLRDEGEITPQDFKQQEAAIQLKNNQLTLKKKKVLEDLKKVEIAQKNLMLSEKTETFDTFEENSFPQIENKFIQKMNDNSEKDLQLQHDLSAIDIQEKIGKISSLEAKNKREPIEIKIAELVLNQAQIGNDIKNPSVTDRGEIEKSNKDPLQETSIDSILTTHPVEKISINEALPESLPSLGEIENNPNFFQKDFQKFIEDQEVGLNNQ